MAHKDFKCLYDGTNKYIDCIVSQFLTSSVQYPQSKCFPLDPKTATVQFDTGFYIFELLISTRYFRGYSTIPSVIQFHVTYLHRIDHPPTSA